jgi:hypothetical protein
MKILADQWGEYCRRPFREDSPREFGSREEYMFWLGEDEEDGSARG